MGFEDLEVQTKISPLRLENPCFAAIKSRKTRWILQDLMIVRL